MQFLAKVVRYSSKWSTILQGVPKKIAHFFAFPNFQLLSLENGLSNLPKNLCAKSPQWGLLAHQISSYSNKWFPSNCSWKLGMRKSVQFFLGHPVKIQFSPMFCLRTCRLDRQSVSNCQSYKLRNFQTDWNIWPICYYFHHKLLRPD